MANSNLKENILRLQNQEKELVFQNFNSEVALELGLILIEVAKKTNYNVAIDITVNDYQLFRYGMEGTNPHNSSWIRRKQNTVKMLHSSSLLAGLLMEQDGHDLKLDRFLDPFEYSNKGGGFPIRINGSAVVGCICVSGAPDTIDHQIVVDSVSQFLNKNLLP